MLKRNWFLLAFILVVLFFSCQSNKANLNDSEHRERASEAIRQLGIDMLSDLDVAVPSSALSSSIPQSYKIYKQYVPLYDEYESSYLDGVADVVRTLIPSLYDYIEQEINSLSENGEDFIYDDTSVTQALRSDTRNHLIDLMIDVLSGKGAELDDVFAPSLKEFMSTRSAFLNLSAIEIKEELPIPDQIGIDSIATASVDALFDSLAQSERILKNRIIDRSSDSVYSIFWEVR